VLSKINENEIESKFNKNLREEKTITVKPILSGHLWDNEKVVF